MKKALKIPLYALLAGLIMILAVVYVYYFTTLPESEINNLVRAITGKKLGLEISFQKVNRDIWNRLVIEGVEASISGKNQLPVAYISKLELNYNFNEILRGKYNFTTLLIDSIYARIPQNPNGLLTAGKKEGAKPSPLSLGFDSIKIDKAEIELKDGSIIYLDTLISSFHLDNGNINLDLQRVTADWPARNISLDTLKGAIYSSENGFKTDSLVLMFGNTHIVVAGTMGKSIGKDLNLLIAANPFDFEDLKKIVGVKVPGILDVTGTLRGSFSDFGGEAFIDGMLVNRPLDEVGCYYSFSNKILKIDSLVGIVANSEINGFAKFNFGIKPEQYSFNGHVSHLDLRDIGPALKTDFTGDVSLRGIGFSDKSFSMKLDANLEKVSVDSYYFDQVSGSVAFDLKKIEFLPGFQGRYKNTYINATGTLEYKGDLDITGWADFQDLTDFTGQIFLKELGGKGKSNFHVTGPTLDFDAIADFESDSCWTYGLIPGHIRVDADLKSFISHKVGKVDAVWSGGTLYSLVSDSGYLTASVSGDRVFMDSVSVNGPLGYMAMVGEYNGTSIPPVFIADTLYGVAAKNEFFSRKPLVLNVREEKTEFKQFIMGLGSGTIEALGYVTTDLDLAVDVKATGFQIEPIVEQFYKEKTLKGVWWGDAKLRGSFEKPLIDFDLQIDSLSINDNYLGNLDALLHYKDGYIYSDSTYISSDYGEYDFTGRMPIDLSFGEVVSRLPDNPIALRMTAYGNRLLLAEVFIPTIERFDTDFKVTMDLGGTYSRPTINGQGSLSNGRLKVLDLFNTLNDVNAHFRMNNETIYIDSASAHVSGGDEWLPPIGKIIRGEKRKKPEQVIKASGIMTLITLGNFAYNIDVNGKNFYFISDPFDVRGLADFKLKVRGEIVPTVGGDIALRRLEIRDEFDKFVPLDYDPNIVIEDSTLWNLNVRISAANNIWINNSELDAELKGDLVVERNVGILKILGTLDAIRGTYNLFGQKFFVESGTMQFSNVSVVNPDLDFLVNTRLRSRTAEGQSTQLSTVPLQISGTLINPTINSSSEAGGSAVLSQEDLLKYLLTGNPLISSIQTGFSRKLLENLGYTIPTFIPGLNGGGIIDELSFYPGESGQTELSLAKYLSRSLYVRYSQRLSQQSGRTIGVEYYLKDNVSLNVTREFQNTQNTTGNNGISFDLNINYEF
jgi:autotransporter translocation and assembly factor TamB